MTEQPFEYISHARLEYRDGYRRAYLGDVPEPVTYGVQGALRQYYGVKEGPPIASTLDHIVAAAWPAECTAPLPAPWQGARSRSTARPTPPPSTAASSGWAGRSASSRWPCTTSSACLPRRVRPRSARWRYTRKAVPHTRA